MVDRIEKFFDQLDDRRFKKLKRIAARIEQNDLAGLDIKPMHGHKSWFRCRVGDIRLIFARTAPGRNAILDLNYRSRIDKHKR